LILSETFKDLFWCTIIDYRNLVSSKSVIAGHCLHSIQWTGFEALTTWLSASKSGCKILVNFGQLIVRQFSTIFVFVATVFSELL
jgi:hypothetical protein